MTYTVTIAHTPYTFSINERETLLQAAFRQNVPLPWGCGGGICGVCLAQIISGELAYKGAPLALFEEDIEARKCLPCVGYARSDLVIECPELTQG